MNRDAAGSRLGLADAIPIQRLLNVVPNWRLSGAACGERHQCPDRQGYGRGRLMAYIRDFMVILK
jgi:hypothetical protein